MLTRLSAPLLSAIATIMPILLYEFITGGGWHAIDPREAPGGSLLTEGKAMRDALAADLIRAGARVALPIDSRLEIDACLNDAQIEPLPMASSNDVDQLLSRAGEFAATILVAPEFDEHLLKAARAVERAGGLLASPSSEFIGLASSKHDTAERLAAASIPVPRGLLMRNAEERAEACDALDFPVVVKPNDGAGSIDVRLARAASAIDLEFDGSTAWRLEEMAEGQSASVAVICGDTPIACPASYQRLDDDGTFAYLGGRRITDASLDARARQLALRAVAALGPTVGYVGVDLILGAATDGSADYVIEVNPRLTTSYVGLRQMTPDNLAEAMLRAANGRVAELSWNERAIEFDSSGTVRD